MKLVSFGEPGRERPGVWVGDTIIDLGAADPRMPATVRGILESDLLARVREIADSPPSRSGVAVASAGVRLGPPVTDPSKIVCLGLNYRDHAEEQGRAVPETPMLFSKGPNALCGNGDAVPYPRGVAEFDYEAELAFVIGRRARCVDAAAAFDFVAGYAVFMDLSARDLQRTERQWFRAKSADGSGPFGPWLVTRDEVADPHALDIALDVNGETLQSSNTRELVFGIDFLVHYISQTITLEPGDVIATGTPAGVGVYRNPPHFLAVGDRVRARIAGLGVLDCAIGPGYPDPATR
jgi:2-keto-4-pentenoate hydratase/2-oxohepta-3-ene-1,7-dioic acid hydratase in catechol pathway